MMNNLSGRTIKGYELRECIGEGGFGAVYRAYQPAVEREVAIKVILPQHANQPEFIRRFEVEAQLIARLQHPHIVPLHDYWRDPDGAYLVMRWLPHNLRAALQRGPWSVEAAAKLLEQLAGALNVAHREGVVHRDIKPDNILLDEDNNAYVADFGIAKDLGVRDLTDPNTMLGSPAYVTPEQIKGEPVTPRSDIYCLGLVTYELIVGQKPFAQAATPAELIFKHLNTPMPSLADHRPNLPTALNEVLQTATAKDPTHRYNSALRFAAAFRAASPAVLRASPQPLAEPLTERELDILRLMAEGLTYKEIAQKLVLALSTVQWYVTKQIYPKLDVHSRLQAIRRAEALHLFAPEPQVQAADDLMADVSTVVEQRPALPTVEPVNPFKGLRAFQEADAADFFGRAALTERLLARLAEGGEGARFLAVVGPSGSGKSSVVKAGLIPGLRQGGLPHPERWFITDMLPGTHPLEELEAALLRVSVNPIPGLLDQLGEDRRGLVRVAKRILPADQDSELLLVIDQFEELFTLVEDEAVRAHFIDNLLSAVTDPRSRVRVVLTLRADFYDRPLLYPRLAELVRSQTEVVVPLTPAELERAIAGPAERVGLSLEHGLATAIVTEVGQQPGALPLLQYALTELYEQREGLTLTQDAYRETGGISGALARRADELYDSLDEGGKAAAQQLFLRLITLGEGTGDTRRRALLSELLSVAGHEGIMDEALETFSQYRLLTFDRDPLTRGPTVEVAHEALLREWGRLRGWLDESREDIRTQRRLTAAAGEWEQAGHDPSFLAGGSRLEGLEQWAAETTLALTANERDYLEASVAERIRQETAEQTRQAREKRLERRSLSFLRALVVVLLLATLGAFGLTGVAVNQSQIAQVERQRAEANAQLSQSLALASGAQAALSEGNVDLALALSVVANQIDQPPALAQRMLFEAAYGPGVTRIYTGHTDAVRSVAVSPDGRTVLSASQDGSLILWDVQTGEQMRQFTGHEGNVWTVVFHPDGRTALSGSADKTMILWDVETGAPIRRFTGHTEDVRMVAISPDGRTALSASYDDLAILWDIETGAEIRRFVGHEDSVWTVAFSPDGRTMLSGSGNTNGSRADTTMRWWNLETGEEMRRFEGHTDTVRTVAFSPDGRTALSGSFDTTLILWDLNMGTEIRRFEGHTGRVTGVAFSSDGRTALSGSTDTTLILWDITTGQSIYQFRGHSDAVVSVALGPDGHSAFSASHDRTLRLWDLESTAEVYQIANTLPVAASVYVAFSPDGQTIALRLGPTNVALRDAETGQVSRYLEGYEGDHLYSEGWNTDNSLRGIVFSPDGRTIATGREGGGWILWDAATGQAIRRFGEGRARFGVLAFSPDGRWLATPGDAVVRLWDVETGTESRRFEGSTDWINDLAFSPDGRYLAAAFGTYTGAAGGGTSDTSLRVWDITTGEEIRRIEHPAQVTGVAFSPDGQTLYSSAFDGALREWDFASGRELRRLVGSESGLVKMALSSDGRYVITAAYSGEIAVWNVETGEQLRRFRVAGEPESVAFSPDGAYALGSGGHHGSLHVWRLALNLHELLDWTYANRDVRELNCTERELYRIEPLCNADGTLPTSVASPANR